MENGEDKASNKKFLGTAAMAGWSIWKARNEAIFQGTPISFKSIALKMEQAWNECQSLMIKPAAQFSNGISPNS